MTWLMTRWFTISSNVGFGPKRNSSGWESSQMHFIAGVGGDYLKTETVTIQMVTEKIYNKNAIILDSWNSHVFPTNYTQSQNHIIFFHLDGWLVVDRWLHWLTDSLIVYSVVPLPWGQDSHFPELHHCRPVVGCLWCLSSMFCQFIIHAFCSCSHLSQSAV